MHLPSHFFNDNLYKIVQKSISLQWYEIIRNRHNIFEQTKFPRSRGIQTTVPRIFSRYCLLFQQNPERHGCCRRCRSRRVHPAMGKGESFRELSCAEILVQEETDEQTWNTIVETEIISLLSDYIRHLPSECAKIMELVMQGYNSTEISTLTGASSSTVRSQKQRGISLLKKMVSPELYALLMLFLQQNN